MFHTTNWEFSISIRLSSFIRFQVGLSKGSAPLFEKMWVRSKSGLFTIASEECWSCFIKTSLIGHETVFN